MSTLEDYARAYCSKDIDSMMAVFHNSDNISVIGTGADELCVGRQAVRNLFERNFQEATATKFEWNWIDVRKSDNHAVVAVTMTIHIDYEQEPIQVPIRWTVVLKNEHNQWLWMHRNASTAASDQKNGEAYPKDN